MTDKKDQLAYLNDDDRAYGLAGMTISLAALDALDRVAEVWLDAPGPMVNFSHEYYFVGSPSVSPKAAWETLLGNFNLTASMALANLLSRTLVREGHDPDRSLLDQLFDTIAEEGRESCSLEDDEVKLLFEQALRFNRRIFGNPRIRPAVGGLASVISRRRRLSGLDLREELAMLNIF